MPRLFKNLLHCIWFNLSFIIASDQYWQQSVDYEMNVTLIDSVRQLACSSTIMYKNNSPDELNDIFIHLYPNAFQLGSVKSRDYLNGYGRESRAAYFKDGLDGYESKIHVRNLTIAKNDNFISDNFKIDDTVLRAKLKQPLLPGEKLRIDIDWNHHVGGMVERAGYYEGQYNMAQWYPKVAVYDKEGWHADPFHAEGEFYGEFGNFKVTFELPAKYIIGASGVVTKGDPGWNMVKVDSSIDFQDWFENFEKNYIEPDSLKTRTVQFLAENVHDFAWVASPNFLYEHGRYKDIDVHVLYNRVNAYDWNRVVRERSVRALKWLTEKFGEYSYPQVTNTDRLKSGGMEYPMLIMDGSDSESLILHEIGHIWFYGILGNNELDEAWIDEGFTTAQTRDYMMDRYGTIGFDWQSDEWTDKYQRKFWSFNNKLHNDQWSSINYILSGYDEPISRKSYLFKNSTSYRQNAYTKPSLMLNELKYILGDSLYYLSIQDFYKKWELKHVDEEKFIESVEKVSGKELDWFFDAWLHDTRVMDYSIQKWHAKKNDDGTYKVFLKIKNLGNRHMPQLVETEFYDGSTKRIWWENNYWNNEDEFIYDVSKKPVRLSLDPDAQSLDVDYRNNSTKLKRKITFDWPGMNYKPRDKIVYTWLPSLYYNNIDSYSPGLQIRKSYGSFENQIVKLNHSLEKDPSSKKHSFYWYYEGSFKPVHNYRNLKLNFKVFDQPGLKSLKLEMNKTRFTNGYRSKPKQNYKLGFYVQSNVDTQRTNLFAPGKLSSVYFNHLMKSNYFEFETDISNSLSPFSKWDFSKISFTIKFKQAKSFSSGNIFRYLSGFTHAGIRARSYFGKIWHHEQKLPTQVSFKIAGNQSRSMYEKSYLRSENSFFEFNNFNEKYHLPSDGNIRAFINDNYSTDELVAFSSELYFLNKKVNSNGYFENRLINTEIALFADAGIFNRFDKIEKLANAGLGFRFSSVVFNKPVYLRVDLPLIIIQDEKITKNSNIIFSFNRAI